MKMYPAILSGDIQIVQDQLDLLNEEWERDASELDRLQREQDEAQAALNASA